MTLIEYFEANMMIFEAQELLYGDFLMQFI